MGGELLLGIHEQKGQAYSVESKANARHKGTPHVKKNVFFRATCTSFSAVIKEYIKCIF